MIRLSSALSALWRSLWRPLFSDLLLAWLWLLVVCLLVWFAPQATGSWRVALALPALLLAPGYLLTVSFFPGRADLSGVSRAALTLGFSLVAVPLVALMVSLLGVRITPQVVAAGLLGLGLLGVLVGVTRRVRLGNGQAFLPQWGAGGLKFSAVLTGIALVAVVGLGGLVGLLRTRMPVTEFYMLNSAGVMGEYPTRQAGHLILRLAVRNLEGKQASYRIVSSVGACPVGGERLVPAGQEWKVNWSCAASDLKGLPGVHFTLYRDGLAQPYRQLQLQLR